MAFLDENGLRYLWAKIEALVSKFGEGDMLKSTYDADGDGVVDNAKKVNGKTVESNVPANAKFTDTVYTHPTHTDKSSGLYKVVIDALGHVTGATAVTKADITDLGIPAQDTKVTVVNNLTSTSTADALSAAQGKYLNDMVDGLLADLGEIYVDISQMGNKYALKTDITGVYKYKGTVPNVANLPTSGNTVGDVYNVEARGINYAWDGYEWDNLGELFTEPVIANATIDTIVTG